MNGMLLKQYELLGIDRAVFEFADEAERSLKERFERIDETAGVNQLKVLDAMRKNRISAEHLSGSTGYGYNDAGRDDLEKVYADTFHTQAALVRPQITCGTHALAIALSAVLRPGDELLSVTGKPYDTLEEVIGIRPSAGSLAEFGISYRQLELTGEGRIDIQKLSETITDKTKVCAFQRSKGYLSRPSLGIDEIGRAIRAIKDIRSDIIVMVDNCYGEFVTDREPSDEGADMIVGSLIKNPGGGLAPIGGYIAGTEECIEKCGVRLTAPGLGREVGATMDVNRSLYQGFFMAPCVTAAALKAAVFASAIYSRLGFETYPGPDAERTDIIQAVTLGSPKKLMAFCEGIQTASPIDSFVTPVGAPMPGYDCDVIMAAGAFIQGASIELSADGPMREPYNVYFQGGLTWPHARFGIVSSLQALYEKGLVKL